MCSISERLESTLTGLGAFNRSLSRSPRSLPFLETGLSLKQDINNDEKNPSFFAGGDSSIGFLLEGLGLDADSGSASVFLRLS